jgi:microcystin-dependent protein
MICNALPPLPPIGAVIAYAGPIPDPSTEEGKQIRANLASVGWLFCDGQALSRKDCFALYGVIGNAFGGNSDTFNLPDLRGCFIRGVDGGAKRDPDSAQRAASGAGGNAGDQVGSLQQDAYQGHEHQYDAVAQGPIEAQGGSGGSGLVAVPNQSTTNQTQDPSPGYGAPKVSSETRPLNLYLNYIIRYQ